MSEIFYELVLLGHLLASFSTLAESVRCGGRALTLKPN